MDAAETSSSAQAIAWSGDAGRAWVEAQGVVDDLFAPIEHLLAEEVGALSPGDVLDVGCGTGATTIAFARRIGAGGRCLGVDISQPMIDAATERAAAAGVNARFLLADA